MTFDEEEKRILFICRDYYKTLDWALLNFLKSVDWSRPGQVQEAHRMLNEWAKMQPDEAIALLSPAIPDEVPHLHATRRIGELADDALYIVESGFDRGDFALDNAESPFERPQEPLCSGT